MKEIDSLLLSDSDLDSLGIDYERDPVETETPTWNHIDESDPCQQAKWVSGLQPWEALRRIESRGSSNFAVTQNIALYRNPQAARSVFDRYAGYVARCRTKGGQETYTMTSHQELAWSKPTQNEVGQYAGNIAAWNVRVIENVVIDIDSARREDGVATVASIADRIAAKAIRK